MTKQTLRGLVLGAALMASGAAWAGADPFQDHVDRAHGLMNEQRYTEALRELTAAQALRQPAALFLDIARTQQRLGQAQEALESYRRYLLADEAGDPALRAEAEAQVGQLGRLLGVPAAMPMPMPQRDFAAPQQRMVVRENRGLIKAGLATFIPSYVAAYMTGTIILGLELGEYQQRLANGSAPSSGTKALMNGSGPLLIPVAGPFIAALTYREPVWSFPWALVDGAAQVAGLAMIIAGARGRVKVPTWTEHARVIPYSTPQGGGLMVAGQY